MNKTVTTEVYFPYELAAEILYNHAKARGTELPSVGKDITATVRLAMGGVDLIVVEKIT